MTINEILEYIDRSPYSINKTILKGMIESLDVEGAGAIDVPEVPAIEMDELVVKKNGVFRAPEGKAYNKVIVNVKEKKNE
jgi:hypothetical protein